jgi:hypothetical protein
LVKSVRPDVRRADQEATRPSSIVFAVTPERSFEASRRDYWLHADFTALGLC